MTNITIAIICIISIVSIIYDANEKCTYYPDGSKICRNPDGTWSSK